MAATRYIQTGSLLSSSEAAKVSSGEAAKVSSGSGSRRRAASTAPALDAAVAAVRAEAALRQQRTERRARIQELLAAEGLGGYQVREAGLGLVGVCWPRKQAQL